MIRGPARERLGTQAGQAAHKTAIQPNRHHIGSHVRGLARANVVEARQQRRTDQVVVAEHGGPQRQRLSHAAELPPVQHLPVREV